MSPAGHHHSKQRSDDSDGHNPELLLVHFLKESCAWPNSMENGPEDEDEIHPEIQCRWCRWCGNSKSFEMPRLGRSNSCSSPKVAGERPQLYTLNYHREVHQDE